MEKEKFEAVLVLLIPQIVDLIVKNCCFEEVSAYRALYDSKIYALLEQEDTKLWHLSPLTLFNLFEEERQTGKITFPEEA